MLITCLLLSLTMRSLTATNAPQKWQLDPPKTNINFQVNYLKNATVNGHFNTVKGSIDYNMNDPADTTINIIVDTNSIDTDLKIRDAFLRRKELLNPEQYPTITFVSKKVSMITPKEADVTGDFTVLGQTKPLTVRVTLSEINADPITQQPVLNFKATGILDRYDYGVTAFPKMVGNLISIEISGQLVAGS